MFKAGNNEIVQSSGDKTDKSFKKLSKSSQKSKYDFSKIAAPLISILKTTRLSDLLAPKLFKANNNKIVRDNSNRYNKKVKN